MDQLEQLTLENKLLIRKISLLKQQLRKYEPIIDVELLTNENSIETCSAEKICDHVEWWISHDKLYKNSSAHNMLKGEFSYVTDTFICYHRDDYTVYNDLISKFGYRVVSTQDSLGLISYTKALKKRFYELLEVGKFIINKGRVSYQIN